MIKKYILFLILPFVLLNCYKDNDNSEPEDIIIEITEVYIDTKIAGDVIDSNGDKLTNYSLKINNYGYEVKEDKFLILLSKAKQRGQTIFVEKSGETIGMITALLVENDINQLHIQTFPNWTNTQANTNNAHIALGNLSIDIAHTKFKDKTNQSYSGALNISHGPISPDNKITNIGFSNLSEVLVLEPLGGFYIDILDDNLDPLSIISTNPIEISYNQIPINATALFYFDKDNEYWIKTTNIDQHTSNISIEKLGHYIFATHDTGTFVSGDINFNGDPISYQILFWSNQQISKSFISTMNGKWITILPVNNKITIDLKNECNQTIQSEYVETTSINIEEESITVDDINQNYQLIDLTIVDCDGAAVQDPSILINETTTYHFEGSTINTWLALGCKELHIAGNSNGSKSGPSVSWSTDSSESIHILSNCEELSDGFSYINIDQEIKMYESFNFETEEGKSIFTSKNNTFKIIIDGETIGSYQEHQVNIYINDNNFGNQGFFVNCTESVIGCGITECVISKYDNNPQGWITVKLKGKVWMQNLKTNIASYLAIEAVVLHQIN